MDDSVYVYKSSIKAKLIEINPKILKDNTRVINEFPEEDGYFFIMDLPQNNAQFPPKESNLTLEYN